MALIPLENTKKLMNTLNLKIAFVNEVSNDMTAEAGTLV